MKILIVTRYDENGPSSRVRVYQYLPFLDRRNIEYKLMYVVPTKSVNHNIVFRSLYYSMQIYIALFKIILNSKNCQVLLNQKVVFPTFAYKLFPFLFNKIIFEFDDALFLQSDGQKGFAANIIQKLYKKSFDSMLSISSHVITTNSFNKEYVSKFCRNITVIPGPIDSDRYKPTHLKKQDCNIITLGWIGSHSTAQYLKEVESVLIELKIKYPMLSVVIIGANNYKELENLEYIKKEWKYEEELADLNLFDIGIVPQPNTEWVKGKGAYKLFQYMSMGIPSVSSPVGIVNEIVEEGINGFTAKNSQEWMMKLSSLIEDSDLRKRIGTNARQTIEKEYSLLKASEKIIELLTA